MRNAVVENANLSAKPQGLTAELILKYLGIFGAIATFGWTAWTYLDGRARELEVRRIEASKPFLEKQLKLFEEVTEIDASLATSVGPSESPEKTRRFWELYWGVLPLVEHGKVEGAMRKFGDLLKSGAKEEELGVAALEVAHACREELGSSWQVESWQLDKWQRGSGGD
jgi:hypothetical protein